MGCSNSRSELQAGIQAKMPEAKLHIDESENYHIAQLFTSCLAEMAYYIESEKEAIVIDPLRETEPYIEYAKKRGATIKYILLTHFHADFISGHVDLAKKTGAKIVYGPTAKASFDFHLATDGEKIPIGKVNIEVLHTPGHTQESSCYLLLDGERQHAVFTGDTLFLGEVGRPDLAVKSGEITKEDLAGWMYDSLRNKIMKLDPKVIVYPGHGAGSPCGKKISDGTFDTLENQLKTNYALQEIERDQFVTLLSSDLPAPPQYFFHDVAQNKSCALPVEEVVSKNLNFIPATKFLSEVAKVPESTIIDTRAPKAFEKGFIPGSVNVSLSITFAIWVGTLFKPETKFFIVAENGKEKESIIRLARIGYDNVLGCLEGGFEAFQTAHKHKDEITVVQQENLTKEMHFVDVRNAPELSHGYIKGAHNIPLGQLEQILKDNSNNEALPKDKPIYIYCKSGARSMIASSLLKKYGYTNHLNVDGGFESIKKNQNLEFQNI
ncbi:metallo-beta-lactamase family protein (macronuclear) [Tetrahymena thermophila SB210]|uniref:Metallo-beta-lactamase family protein n=1 Tax=Tetrahymena thermophila (strain SB210) TaxID=312017 RepID=I7M1D2_TETTS|nr:metallo-beta-lactamase family protein [Tetrahymena thermophila SB210]EAR96103.1 metallo-beta-lactamase family protein [Tetrahymena thermophila SB210]|eukprot:XP_001016348.1 metallo-beta-lactamase family protein [Tetrahymena thermophila SB210]